MDSRNFMAATASWLHRFKNQPPRCAPRRALALGVGRASSAVVIALATWVAPVGATSKPVAPGATPAQMGSDPQRAPALQPARVFGMRKFPYPYDAMLAISSDADHQTLRKFNLIHEFINTTAMTPMGRGLGLDFADSVFMFNGSDLPGAVDYGNRPISDEMSYFRGTSAKALYAAIIDRYIHAGWIDTLHSFGDFSTTNPRRTRFKQELAVRALRALEHSGDRLTVWTDHGDTANVDDFGAYGRSRFYDYQKGANPGSADNIANLVIRYGVRFVWADEQSDFFGYNSIIYPKQLPDGLTVWGFWRYTNTGYTRAGNPEWCWTVGDLDQELSISNLLQLENQRQYAIVAQHLSANNDAMPLPPNSIAALRLLARQDHEGHILVTRTSRLLQYNVTQQYLRYTVSHHAGRAIIHIVSIDDPVFGAHRPVLDELRGVTFYTSNPRATVLEVGNTPISAHDIVYHKSDGVHASVGIRWFPTDTRNYAVWSDKTALRLLVHAPRPLRRATAAGHRTWWPGIGAAIGSVLRKLGV